MFIFMPTFLGILHWVWHCWDNLLQIFSFLFDQQCPQEQSLHMGVSSDWLGILRPENHRNDLKHKDNFLWEYFLQPNYFKSNFEQTVIWHLLKNKNCLPKYSNSLNFMTLGKLLTSGIYLTIISQASMDMPLSYFLNSSPVSNLNWK